MQLAVIFKLKSGGAVCQWCTGYAIYLFKRRPIGRRCCFNCEDYSHQIDGDEFWFTRNLQGMLGYSKWENFAKVIEKAKIACQTAGHFIADHFPDVRKTISMPKGSEKEIDDLMLTGAGESGPVDNGKLNIEEPKKLSFLVVEKI